MEDNGDAGSVPALRSPPEPRLRDRGAVPGRGQPRPLALPLPTPKPRRRAPGWGEQHLPERGAEQGRTRERRGVEGEETLPLQWQLCRRISSCSPLQNGRALLESEETMAYLLLEQKPLINLAYVQERAITCPPTLRGSSSAQQPPFHPILLLGSRSAHPERQLCSPELGRMRAAPPSPSPPGIQAA